MKLIIDIPEEQYNDIVKHLTDNDGNYAYSDFNLREIIRNGTPLPKGHGRLIDADCLNAGCGIHACYCIGDCDKCSDVVVSYDDIKNAETIVEADKETQDETDN